MKISNKNKKILESKRIIKEEKQKIRMERKNIKRKKLEKLKKSKVFGFLFKDDNNKYSFSEILWVSLFSILAGGFLCFFIMIIVAGGFDCFKYSRELDKFYEVYGTMVDNYYEDVTKDELIDSAIDGMMSSVGDIYTGYTDASGVEDFDELVNGVYEGIGCTIQLQENGIKIIEVYEDSPSEKAGLKINDLILKVDNIEVTKDTDVNDISKYIKSESNGKIKMIISRDEKEMEVNLTRGKVEQPVVATTTYEKNDKKIGYINISIFSSVAAKQFEKKLKDLEKRGIDSLVIDVRGNNGGYLTTVTDIVSLLLPKDKAIYQVEKDGKKHVTYDKTSASRKYPIAVLVNEGSASASEILAASVKESYGGFVVGMKTYGKGTVQQVKKLSDGSMIKYTVENWLTPKGNWINEVGIEPTDKVEMSEAYYLDSVPNNDNQLQKALELVSK